MDSCSVVIIIPCGPGVHRDHESAQRNTWAKNAPTGVRVLWVRDGKSLSFDENSATLVVPTAEGLEHLLEKTLLAIDWAVGTYSPKYVVRTNTSSYWDIELLLAQLDTLPKRGCYAGFIGSWTDPNGREIVYVSGSGIRFSADVASIITQMRVEDYKEYFDDVAIGKYLAMKGVEPSELHRTDITDFAPPNMSAHSRVKNWNDPLATSRRMYLLHALYNADGAKAWDHSMRLYRRLELELAKKALPLRKQCVLLLSRLWKWGRIRNQFQPRWSRPVD